MYVLAEIHSTKVDGIDFIDEEDGGVIVDFDPQAMSMTDGGDFFANGHNFTIEDPENGELNRVVTEGGSFTVGTASHRLSGSFTTQYKNVSTPLKGICTRLNS